MMGACRGAALEHEAEALDGNQAGAGSSGDSLDDSPEGDSEQGASEEAGDSGGSSEQEGSESDTDGAEHSGPPRGRGDSAKRKAASVADVSASSKAKEAAAKKPRLEVEDDFMKLDDMEAFVQEAERRATAGRDEGVPRCLALPCPPGALALIQSSNMCLPLFGNVIEGMAKRTEL